MNNDSILEKLLNYINSNSDGKENSLEIKNINENSILSEIGMTSVEFVLFLIFIEDELDIMFEDDDLLMTNEITLGELANRIMQLQK